MAPLATKVVLFGGWAPTSPTTVFNDTWALDFTSQSWTQASASSPPAARTAASMAPLGSKLVLFGGEAKGGVQNDTWTFDGTNWTQVNPSTSPPARQLASMAPLGNVLVLFGGEGTNGALNDTWTFDGTNWKQLDIMSAPPPRESASMAYLP
jgi:N-acetylneuraminic acid mutarotase